MICGIGGMNMITIYTQPTCGKCRVLKSKLDKLGIPYQENQNISEMQRKGFLSTPMMVVGNDTYNFSDALQWIESEENI